MGIPPLLVKNKSVLEFGPGSGHNSIYTAQLTPKRYHLVDANPKGLNDTRELLSSYNVYDLEVIDSLFLDYQSNSRYDLVWAEGCIPLQAQPIPILNHLSSFTKKEGIFVTSTSNGISFLSETIRRLASSICMNASQSINEQLDTVRPLLDGHLAHLKYMSRPVDDWLVDSILQPLQDRKHLSIPCALETLKDYDLYGSSPKFITDWRWYKEFVGEGYDFNEVALDCYYKNNINLIDCRFVFESHSIEFGQNLEATCNSTWDVMCQIQGGDLSKWQEFFILLDNISNLIKKLAPETAVAIEEANQWLQDGAPVKKKLSYFPQWWGRGQQYLSFIRR